MKNNETKVREWYLLNVKPEELDKNVKATLDYVKRFNEPEDGEWVLWAREITSGNYGQFITSAFLDDVLNNGNSEQLEPVDDEMIDLYDDVCMMLAKEFNRGSKLVGAFYIGQHEADGSLGVFYKERVSGSYIWG